MRTCFRAWNCILTLFKRHSDSTEKAAERRYMATVHLKKINIFYANMHLIVNCFKGGYYLGVYRVLTAKVKPDQYSVDVERWGFALRWCRHVFSSIYMDRELRLGLVSIPRWSTDVVLSWCCFWWRFSWPDLQPTSALNSKTANPAFARWFLTLDLHFSCGFINFCYFHSDWDHFGCEIEYCIDFLLLSFMFKTF